MFQRMKAALLRIYYRWSNRRVWKGKFPDPPSRTLQIPGTAGPISARLYASAATAEQPLIVYIHGGGWVIGDLDSHHPFCQLLAEQAACAVIALDYRLAPEHPYPAATDDCLAAAQWIAAHLADLGPNNGGMVIAGDSAGGNLTAATCLALEGSARKKLCGAVTLYPAVDHYRDAPPSYTERAKAKPLTANLMIWFWDTWLGRIDPAQAHRAFPLRSPHLDSLPPLFNVTAEFDPLRDEGQAFAQAVEKAGVPVEQHHFRYASHGFACSSGPTEEFRRFMDSLCHWLGHLPSEDRSV